MANRFLLANALFLFSSMIVSPLSSADKFVFDEQLLAVNCGYALGLAPGDLDGGGDADINSADATKNSLFWFQNQGRWKRHTTDKRTSWPVHGG